MKCVKSVIGRKNWKSCGEIISVKRSLLSLKQFGDLVEEPESGGQSLLHFSIKRMASLTKQMCGWNLLIKVRSTKHKFNSAGFLLEEVLIDLMYCYDNAFVHLISFEFSSCLDVLLCLFFFLSNYLLILICKLFFFFSQ